MIGRNIGKYRALYFNDRHFDFRIAQKIMYTNTCTKKICSGRTAAVRRISVFTDCSCGSSMGVGALLHAVEDLCHTAAAANASVALPS